MTAVKKDMPWVVRIQRVIVPLYVCFFCNAAHGYSTHSQISLNYLPSVVTIVALDVHGNPRSAGSGFFINGSGDIVTSHHVLEGCARAAVITTGGDRGAILEILKNDPRLDLLVARTSIRNTQPLILADGARLVPGDKVICLGNGMGSRGRIAKGVIYGVREAEGVQLIQITALVSEGSSGGPVLNAEGEVIGIAMAFLSQGNGLNFAVPVDYLKSLKTVSLMPQDLPRATTRFEAALSDGEVTELFLTPKVGGPGTVYFRNGRTLLCDRAWKDSDTIFLVVHGKDVAIGYESSLIDMQRSFARTK
jgi:S1-C subfamily serine protease